MKKQRIKELEKQATHLIHLWCEYVSFLHHKESDGIWWIEKRWSWDEKPKWYVMHQGYHLGEIEIECESYEEALEELIEAIKKAFKERLEWAENVLKLQEGYSDDQIEAAWWLKVVAKYEKLI